MLMEKIRLLLVDDHTVLRSGLKALFDRQPDIEVVAEADSATFAYTQAVDKLPDVVLLDLTMPGGGSLELIGKLRSLARPPRVLVLTMHDEPAYARAALAAGAAGYVVKTIGEQDLLAAVRAVRRGQTFVDLDNESLTASIFQTAGPSGSPATATRLSERESEVLRLLGQGFTNQAVAERLDLSPKTVATYRARIADKLGLKTTADFVRYATDTGQSTPAESDS